jgi:hypothetical protein
LKLLRKGHMFSILMLFVVSLHTVSRFRYVTSSSCIWLVMCSFISLTVSFRGHNYCSFF